ncbi:mechanosensitive ion channel [bacterium]|nr:mechanosensitive ion channel [bacterium]
MDLNFLSYNLFGNSIKAYLISLIVFIISLFVLIFFKKEIIKKLQKIARKTKTDIDDLIISFIANIKWPLYFFIALWIASKCISIKGKVESYFSYFILAVVIFYLALALNKLVDFSVSRTLEKRKLEGQKVNVSAIDLLGKVVKGTVWAIAILIVLENFGVNISALIAGLGIGGIAVAFALQNVLADVFACFSIYFDKPFEIGDFIIVDSDAGTVEKIGIKSTRIRTLQGEELIISNKELTEKRVHNYKKMQKRRIVFSLGITYDTPTEKLIRVPEIIKNIIDSFGISKTDRVHFKNFGDFSLNFEVVYYLDSSDYKVYMDTQEKINLGIKQAFEKEKISMAFPTQTIIINKEG